MAITLKNKNYSKSTLASGISDTDTQLTVATGEGSRFPSSGSFRAVLWGSDYSSPLFDPNREIVTMTLNSGDTFDIIRGQEDTTAKAWSANDNVAHVLTAGKIDEIETEITNHIIAGDPHTQYLNNTRHDTTIRHPISVGGTGASTAAGARTNLGVNTLAEIIDAIYPVGSIYISTLSTNPGTLWGVGTWTSFGAGRVLVGIDTSQSEFDTVEKTGGAKTHTLTSSELASHNHTFTSGTESADHTHSGSGTTSDRSQGHQHGPAGTNTDYWGSGSGGGVVAAGSSWSTGIPGTNTGWETQGHTHSYSFVTSGRSATHTHSGTTNSTGGGEAHNNLQPYIVVYMWKRTE